MKPVTPFENYPSFGNAGSRQAPGDAKYALGFVPADTLPAEWANYFFHGATKGISDLNTAVRSLWQEMNSVLSDANITPDATVNNQLLQAIRLNNSFVTATGTTVNGPLLINGATVRILFTQDILGSNTSTGLTVTYNGQTIPVKVYKEGTLETFTAAKVSWRGSVESFKYLDAGTTLELFYDSVQFIILDNPVVLKSNLYTIYADGRVGGSPIGTVIPYTSYTVPYGWLPAHGATVSRTEYSKLFSVIGTRFGNGDGSTTFKLPDFSERVPKGLGLAPDADRHYSDVALSIGGLIDDCIQKHTHTYSRARASSGKVAGATTGNSYLTDVVSSDTGNATLNDTTETKAIIMYYLIKAL